MTWWVNSCWSVCVYPVPSFYLLVLSLFICCFFCNRFQWNIFVNFWKSDLIISSILSLNSPFSITRHMMSIFYFFKFHYPQTLSFVPFFSCPLPLSLPPLSPYVIIIFFFLGRVGINRFALSNIRSININNHLFTSYGYLSVFISSLVTLINLAFHLESVSTQNYTLSLI